MAQAKDTRQRPYGYREFDVIELPTGVPEIGVQAGHAATIVDLSDSSMTVEISDSQGKTLDLVDLVIGSESELRIIGRWRIATD